MKSIRQLLSHFRKPPVIRTTINGQEYEVTEWCRKRAAMNMATEPTTKAAVIALLQKQFGEKEGLKIAKQRYPEAF